MYVQGLLVESCDQSIVFKCDREVHEVNLVRELRKLPFQARLIHCFFQLVLSVVGAWDPDSKYIIYKASVEWKVLAEVSKES